MPTSNKMGASNSTYNDQKHMIGNLVHPGAETNIGFINLHNETVSHGIQTMSLLLALVMVTIIICKCSPILITLYEKCFMKHRDPYMEYQNYLAQNRMNILYGDFKQNHELKLPQRIHDPCTTCHQIQMMKDKGCQTEEEVRIDPPQFQESMV